MITSGRMRRQRLRARYGFTLLELILAIGLTTILMAAVYGAMSAYWSLALDSYEDVERTRVAGSLFAMLSEDIQSCTFVEQTTSTTDTDTETDESDSGPTEVTTSTYRNGLIGTERDLVLYISRPDSSLNYVPALDAVGTTDRDSDLMIVRWLLADTSAGGLAAAVAEANPQDGIVTVAGLARGSGGVTGFGNAIDQDDFDLQSQTTSLQAEEVQEVLFAYYDGVDWLTEWNSSTLNKMPQAVKIEITLRGDDNSSPPVPATQHALVVPIPVASPYVEETAL